MNRFLKITICLLFISCSSKKGTDVRIYLPENYNKKYVIIFYNQKNGLPKEMVNGEKIYRVPKSGILYTQDQQQLNVMFHEDYFFVNNNEIRRIPSYSYTKFHEEKIDPKKPMFSVALARIKKILAIAVVIHLSEHQVK